MKIYISLVIGDVSDDGIRSTVATNWDVIRQDLLEFYNDAVDDGGLDDGAERLPEDASMRRITASITNEIGREVVLQESWLLP